jgi:hypothetical protein
MALQHRTAAWHRQQFARSGTRCARAMRPRGAFRYSKLRRRDGQVDRATATRRTAQRRYPGPMTAAGKARRTMSRTSLRAAIAAIEFTALTRP